MTTINKTALVPYSASEMYALVNDIGSYSKFLPWCRSSQILEQGEDVIRATIEIAHGSLHKSFTTNNRLQRDKMIEMRWNRDLSNNWRVSGASIRWGNGPARSRWISSSSSPTG